MAGTVDALETEGAGDGCPGCEGTSLAHVVVGHQSAAAAAADEARAVLEDGEGSYGEGERDAVRASTEKR